MAGVTVAINNLGAGHMYEVSEEVEQLLMILKSSGAVRHIRRRVQRAHTRLWNAKSGSTWPYKECDQLYEGLYKAPVRFLTSRSILYV